MKYYYNLPTLIFFSTFPEADIYFILALQLYTLKKVYIHAKNRLYLFRILYPRQQLTNSFSNALSDLDFHLSVIKICTTKPLARPIKALAQGVRQWDLLAPAPWDWWFQHKDDAYHKKV